MSILDNDLYAFTMQQAVMEHYPDVPVTYQFIDRKKTKINNPDLYLSRLEEAIQEFSYLSITPEEIQFLASLGFFKTEYLDALEQFRFNPSDLNLAIINGEVSITYTGNWFDLILWETPLLALNSRLMLADQGVDAKQDKEAAQAKLLQIENDLARASRYMNFCEFGTRRRRSLEFQEIVLEGLINTLGSRLIGTSNVHLAHKFNIKCQGSIAHQYIMAAGAMHGLKYANAVAMDQWVQTYRGKLGIALTDTFSTNMFLRNFDELRARIFDGVRQDSGDPVEFSRKMYSHYEKLGIPCEGKRILFSDGLTIEKAAEINAATSNKFDRIYCIGTYFTTDHPLNIVIKMVMCNGGHAVKLSDDFTKAVGDKREVEYAKNFVASLDKAYPIS